MRRREFIALLGGAAVAWPLDVHAQQPERIRRIAMLMGYPEGDHRVVPPQQRAKGTEGQDYLA